MLYWNEMSQMQTNDKQNTQLGLRPDSLDLLRHFLITGPEQPIGMNQVGGTCMQEVQLGRQSRGR